MPKRIPNLSEAILSQATQLFLRMGYNAVDMKQVAAEAGTSVGNLYNYFPSKPALFLAVKDQWKKELLGTCRTILTSETPRLERIMTVLRRFYDDVSQWHGIWHEFMAVRDDPQPDPLCKVKKGGMPIWVLGADEMEFTALFEELLLQKPGVEPPHRWALVLISATLQLAARYPQHREENWKFIETLVDKI